MPLPPPPSPGDVPVAGRDPIDNEVDALAVIAASATRPPQNEILAVLLDDDWSGEHVVNVRGVTDSDAVLDVAELLAELARTAPPGAFTRVVLASIRPDAGDDDDDVVDDPARWMEASSQLAEAGIRLVEWFVVGESVSCPRDLLCDPPRWPPRLGRAARSA